MKRFVLVSLISLFVVTTPHFVSALSTSFSIESVGADIGLGGADLKQTVLNIVQWFLGILALLAIVMIIASVIIAASSGDSDRAERAKRGIVGAVIGLIIVLMAWAIVFFVARTSSNVTSNT